jgi:hypothetical protein
MWRRVIAPAPAGKFPAASLDKDTKPLARLYDAKVAALDSKTYPQEWKGFYCTIKGATAGVIDYLTEDKPPDDAIYVCEQRSPTEYVVTVQADKNFNTVHNWDGWPDPNGTEPVVQKV